MRARLGLSSDDVICGGPRSIVQFSKANTIHATSYGALPVQFNRRLHQ